MLEADLQQHYQVDLTDLWRGTLTLRRLWVLIQGLPADSRAVYAMATTGEDAGPLASWRLGDVLLGRVADELALLRWQWESAHLDPKKQRPRPQPPSVLPEWNPGAASKDVPVVSPHALGGFVNTDDPTPPEEVHPHGY